MKPSFDLGTTWLFAMPLPALDLSSVHDLDVGFIQLTSLLSQRPNPKK
jgi:hypothetical protein